MAQDVFVPGKSIYQQVDPSKNINDKQDWIDTRDGSIVKNAKNAGISSPHGLLQYDDTGKGIAVLRHDGTATPYQSFGDELKSTIPKVLGIAGAGIAAGSLIGGGASAAAGGAQQAAGGGSGGLSTLSKAGDIIGKLSPTLAGLAGGAATGAKDQNTAQNSNYALQLQRAALLQQIQNANRDFALKAPQTQAHQAAIGDVLSSAQPVNVSVPGVRPADISGGLSAANLGTNTRAAGAAMSQQALASLLAGNKQTPVDVPQVPGVQKPGGLSDAASIISLLGTGASALGPLFKKQPVPNTGIVAPPEDDGQ